MFFDYVASTAHLFIPGRASLTCAFLKLSSFPQKVFFFFTFFLTRSEGLRTEDVTTLKGL